MPTTQTTKTADVLSTPQRITRPFAGRSEAGHALAQPPICYDGPQWFAVMTNPQCEHKAAKGLAAVGFRVFYPHLRKWISHARKRRMVERPLFGRYLFVEIDYPRQSFDAVKRVHGVETILHNGGVPRTIHGDFVADLIRREMAGEFDYVRQEPCRVEVKPGVWKDGKMIEAPVHEMRQNAPLPVGARVRVMDGQFDGLLATLTSVRGHKVVAKLLESTQYVKLLGLSVRAA